MTLDYGVKNMSEQICQGCGKPVSECICEGISKVTKALNKEPQVIRIEHVKVPSGEKTATREELEQELETRKMQLTTIALKQLEDKVTKFASVIEDEDKRKNVISRIMDSDDPLSAFEQAQSMKDILLKALGVGGVGVDDMDGAEKTPPSGDARGLPKRTLLASGEEAIDAIYGILGNPKSSEEEKRLARKKADEMIESFIQGRKKAIRENPLHKYHFAYTMCPKCGKSIPLPRGAKRATECPHCNAILTRRIK